MAPVRPDQLLLQGAAGPHYRVAYPEWADKPYGFATFLRAARFVNSLTNGKVLSRRPSRAGGFTFVTYKVRLSTEDRARHVRPGSPEAHRGDAGAQAGLRRPEPGRVDQGRLLRPERRRDALVLEVPDQPRTSSATAPPTAPTTTTLNPTNGDVTNAATQPLANYKPSGGSAPTWCPSQVSPATASRSTPSASTRPPTPAAYQGSLSTVGQAKTRSPWGTLDQGGNAVEWTDTITAPPFGIRGGPRVWRRLHGGVPNSTAYQMWLSAVGLAASGQHVLRRTPTRGSASGSG